MDKKRGLRDGERKKTDNTLRPITKIEVAKSLGQQVENGGYTGIGSDHPIGYASIPFAGPEVRIHYREQIQRRSGNKSYGVHGAISRGDDKQHPEFESGNPGCVSPGANIQVTQTRK
jgi:hypothetical protein